MAYKFLGLTGCAIFNEVYVGLDFMEPSYFDSVLLQKMGRLRNCSKYLGCTAIDKGDLIDGGA